MKAICEQRTGGRYSKEFRLTSTSMGWLFDRYEPLSDSTQRNTLPGSSKVAVPPRTEFI
jgi:hypothetical protein